MGRSLNSQVEKISFSENIKLPTHYKIIKNDGLGSGIYTQTQYTTQQDKFVEVYKSLFKVPGNKFFKYFKKYIINEPVDKRDLMFIVDGEVCVWSEDEDSIVETIIPQGEFSIEYIRNKFPNLIENIKKEVSGINDNQIRKIINIFLKNEMHEKNSESCRGGG